MRGNQRDWTGNGDFLNLTRGLPLGEINYVDFQNVKSSWCLIILRYLIPTETFSGTIVTFDF